MSKPEMDAPNLVHHGVPSRRPEPMPISLEDPASVPSRLAAALLRAKVEHLEAVGAKALPLSVLRCSIEHHGSASTPFHRVELRTNYDFAKLSRLQVDGHNTQEVVDTSNGGALWHAVPVLLWPAKGDLVFLFAYVYREQEPLTNWSLVNSRDEEVTLLSTLIRDSSPGAQLQCSMVIVKGDPATVLAAEVPFDSPALAGIEPARCSKENLPAAAPNAPVSPGGGDFGCDLARLKCLWIRMGLQEKVSALSFGQDVRPLAIKCRKAVADLHTAARQSAQLLGFHTSVACFTLVSALEFVPDPAGGAERPLGMMFSPELVARSDLWEVLEKGMPAWGQSCAKRPLLSRARWGSLFEPLPSSWRGLEAALAALLEQRLLGLMQRVQGSVHRDIQRDEEEDKTQQSPGPSLPSGKRLTRNRRQGKRVRRGEEPKVQKHHAATAQGYIPLIEQSIPDSSSEESEGSTLAPELDVDLLASSQAGAAGWPRPAEQGCQAGRTQHLADEAEVGRWQRVGRGRRRRGAFPARDTADSPSDVAHLSLCSDSERLPGEAAADVELSSELFGDTSKPIMACSEFDRDKRDGHEADTLEGCSSLLRVSSAPQLCEQDCASSGSEDQDRPELEKLLRGWQSSVCVAEACSEWGGARSSDGRGQAYWKTRRNENASWRLWFRQQSRLRKGLTPSHFELQAITEDSPCMSCALGLREGNICSCQPNPWQALTPNESGRDFSGSAVAASSSRSTSEHETASGTGRLIMEGSEPPLSPSACSSGGGDLPVTPWRRLLRSPPAAFVDGGAASHAHLSAEKRQKNAAWRQWWTTHQVDKMEPQYVQPQLLFAPTPTSTYPGTPRNGSSECGSHAFLGQEPPQVVFLPVPVHFASQVQNYIDQLVSDATLGALPQSSQMQAACMVPPFPRSVGPAFGTVSVEI